MINFGNAVFILQYPSGRFGFVGHVPTNLGYTMKDGSPVTPEASAVIVQCGPGFANVKSVTHDSEVEAEAALIHRGYQKNPLADDPTTNTGYSHPLTK